MKLNPKTLLAATVLATIFASSDTMANTCRPPLPSYCNRNCWNARSPKCAISNMSALDRAVIHHTASSGDFSTTGLTDTKSRVRGIQNYHMDTQGWCDIGYHFLVDKHGNILSGRQNSAEGPGYPRGAHDGCNNNSYGFNAMGYFHTPYNQTPTSAQMTGLKKIIAGKMPSGWSPIGSGSSYCGTSDKVAGHRQVLATACPGDKLYNLTKDGSGFENAIAALRPCP
jgi:hypothetical protein